MSEVHPSEGEVPPMSLPRVRVPVALIALLLCPGLLLAQRTEPGPLAVARRGDLAVPGT